MIRVLLGLLCLLPFAAAADAPERSLRPVAPPQALGGPQADSPNGLARIVPVARPGPPSPTPGALRAPDKAETMGITREVPDQHGVRTPVRPKARPSEVVQTARGVQSARIKGQICGDPRLQGVVIGRVSATIPGCGIDDAVRVSSISGVALSTHAVMDCRTATAVRKWLDTGLIPAVGGYGGGVKELHVAAHYACRPRNNVKGAKISEHGRGHAIDISSIRLKDGKDLDVLSDWGKGREGKILRAAHDSGCRIFGTTLGPEANALHRNHFHFDTAPRRGGHGYCE